MIIFQLLNGCVSSVSTVLVPMGCGLVAGSTVISYFEIRVGVQVVDGSFLLQNKQ